MFDIRMLGKAKQAKNTFVKNHPKAEAFFRDVNNKGYCEGQEIAVAVRYPDGTEFKTGIKVTASDLELLNMLREITG